MDIVLSIELVLVFSAYAGILIKLLLSEQRFRNLHLIGAITALVFLAGLTGLLGYASVPFICLLFLSAYCSVNRPRNHQRARNVATLLLGVLCFLFATHHIPGFNNPLVFNSDAFGQSGLPFSLYANLDKALAGLALILAFRGQFIWRVGKHDGRFIGLYLLAFFSICCLFGAKLDPKFGTLTFAFIFFNLAITCVAEEAFFRLLIQQKLAQYLPTHYAPQIAVLLTALIFMLAHFHTDEDAAQRLVLIFLAGLAYGAVYLRHKSLGSAIILHFLINLIHFSFFAYPARFS